jgi:thioredoxin-like negative regulator of GroEL
MEYLMDQLQLETLIGRNPDVPAPAGATLIYFTATWCGACRRLDMNLLLGSLATVKFLKCDVDQNTYSPGFCGVRAIPAFMLIRDGKILGSLQSSNTMDVVTWVNTLLTN